MAKHTVENIYAFMVDDPAQGEAVLTRDTDRGQIPMIGRTHDQLELYRREAIAMATALQMPLITGHFVRKREVRS